MGFDRLCRYSREADRARAPELVSDVHDSFMALIPFPVQGLRWSPGSFQAVLFASCLSSARSQKCTILNRNATPRSISYAAFAHPGKHQKLNELSSTQFKNKEGETPCTVVLDLLVPCNVNISDSSS
jgi:hypothetical protein